MNNTSFYKANLNESDFEKADIRGASFYKASMRKVRNLEERGINYVRLQDAIYEEALNDNISNFI
jgi:uncharacterized protein YjbI with pentapeptide repeats